MRYFHVCDHINFKKEDNEKRYRHPEPPLYKHVIDAPKSASDT